MSNVERTDFLIVGSGVAGLATAVKLGRYGDVRLITKGSLLDSNTRYAQGGIAAAVGPGDTPIEHLHDTLRAGHDLCLTDAATVLVEEAPLRVKELIEFGAQFDSAPDGTLSLGREGAHSRNRILHARGDATGIEVAEVLAEKAASIPSVQLIEHTFAIDLIVRDGRCIGVSARGPQGEPIVYLARGVVLATGGCGRIYKYTTNPYVATGDGFAMAARQRVSLWDMEFVQFHPTALARADDPMVLISEAVRGEGARLINQFGEAFMAAKHEQGDLAPRDIVARAIFEEMSADRAVFLDATHLGDRFPDRFPTIFQACQERGIDPRREPIPIAPAAHFIMGGIHTDTGGRTSLPGLYACGEVACTGVHGANRLASNSLLEGLVFAERIARSMARELTVARPKMSAAEASELVPSGPEADPGVTRPIADRLRTVMWEKAGIARNAQGLAEAAEILADLERQTPPNAWILRNMIQTGRLIVQAAMQREESRGGHYRTDFPTEREEWRGRHVTL